MIMYTQGDLLKLAREGKFDFIFHGCNCFHQMGAGIAFQIRYAFPSVAEADRLTYKGERSKLGSYSKALVQSHPNNKRPYRFTVVNLYTQFLPGPNFNLEALRKSLQAWKNDHWTNGARLGFPRIGAGIGGGDWNEIEDIILEEFENTGASVTVVDYVH